MTNESNHNDSGVSATYRKLARESTPPELDQKILSLAATASRSRYGRARAWIRPVAWAATIGLSLAFVLEMSQLRDIPMQAVEVRDEPTPVLEELVILDEAPARRSAPAAKQQAIPVPASAAPVAADPAPQGGTEHLGDPASVSVEFDAEDMGMLREAEEQARARVGSARASVDAVEAARFDAAVSPEKKEESAACDAAARVSAATWYACVEELRRTGDPAAADAELEALRIKFPEFEEPGQNR